MILITNAINGNINNMNMGLVCNYVFYFILGYKISKLELNEEEKEQAKKDMGALLGKHIIRIHVSMSS